MFYVYHSGEATTDDERVSVIGPEALAELVMDAGLTGWFALTADKPRRAWRLLFCPQPLQT